MRCAPPRQPISAVIFDLDGVLVSTDEFHYLSWQRLADEEGIAFDRKFNERFRGVSRMECLEMLLASAGRKCSAADKQRMADRKNSYYCDMIARLTPADVLPGVRELLAALRSRGVKLAVASGSKNAPAILKRTGLEGEFNVSVSGLDITRSKPDPEVFLKAAKRLGVTPSQCLVVEDAQAGIEAAARAGMRSLGIAPAPLAGAARTVPSLANITADEMLAL
jgi:beta-phosphoglucomutase